HEPALSLPERSRGGAREPGGNGADAEKSGFAKFRRRQVRQIEVGAGFKPAPTKPVGQPGGRRNTMRVETERKMKRWREQRWLLDQVIQTRGLDWDQGRSGKILRNCGAGVESELREINRRVQKFTDIPREFSRAAARREE